MFNNLINSFNKNKDKICSWTIGIIVFLSVYFLLKPYSSKDFFIEHFSIFKSFVDANYFLSVFLFLITYGLVAGLLIPVTGFVGMFGGALYGTILGAIYSTIAFSAATTITLYFLRKFFKNWVIKKLDKYKNKMPNINSNNWFWIIASLYVNTITPTLIVISLAVLSPISTVSYFFATLLGAFPGAVFYSVMGNHLIKLHDTSMPWYTYVGFTVLALVLLVPIFIRGKKKNEKA